MKLGTKSVLFGYHSFWLHGWFVAAAWWRLYGFPMDPRLWVAFFVHDIGYIGKPNMDGEEGETHPLEGAKLMHLLFDSSIGFCSEGHPTSPASKYCAVSNTLCWKWYNFTLYHSRRMAKRDSQPTSRLCVADKLAFVMFPWWMFRILCYASGEVHDYRANTSNKNENVKEWYQWLQAKTMKWIEENK